MSWRKGRRPKRSIWKVVRVRVLDRDGWACVTCGRKRRLEVDHIIPLEDGGKMYELSNTQALCRTHHIEKTKRENQRRQAGPEVVEWQELLEGLLPHVV